MEGRKMKLTTSKLILEIRSAEGGKDSELFVQDLAQAYIRHSNRVG